MKVREIAQVHKSKYGRVVFNNHDLEEHEKETIYRLASFGFDVETIVPSNIPGTKNPDLLMLGTLWEVKGPTSVNEKTVKTMFRKAVKQSGGRAVFDLNKIKGNTEKIEQYIMNLFIATRGMRRIMIIKKGELLLDIIK